MTDPARMFRRFSLAGAVLLILLSGAALPSVGAQLLRVRASPHGSSLRVVLDIEGSTSCTLTRSPKGGNWSARLTGLCRGRLPSPLRNPHPLVSVIEARCDGKDLRVDLTGRQPLKAKAFWIPPGDGKPRRYVIDVEPEGPSNPPKAAVSVPSEGPPKAKPEPGPVPRRSGKWSILLDPGHGGKDPGATRRDLQEKEIALDIARRVEKILETSPGFEARLSRTDDRRIGLRERCRVAEDFGADAFISIHVNAAKKRGAMGVEVFFLSLGAASDEASREVARLENEADPDYVVEEDSLLQGIPFGFDLRQSDTLLRSSRLAETVLGAYETSHLAASRGVKQAGFAVLKSFQVPSILVETGFISNPEEARRLKDPDHRQRLAQCIAQGTIAYFERFARARVESEAASP